MKDLKKMREEFEKELELAKVENNFEERFGVRCHVYDFRGTVISATVGSKEKICKILNCLPADKKFIINDTATGQKNPVESFYRLTSRRGYSDNISSLNIEFFSGIYKISLTTTTDGNIDKFFVDSLREISLSELSTYKPSRGGKLLTNVKIPCRKFVGEQIEYVGGSMVCTDEKIISDIVETLKAI